MAENPAVPPPTIKYLTFLFFVFNRVLIVLESPNSFKLTISEAFDDL